MHLGANRIVEQIANTLTNQPAFIKAGFYLIGEVLSFLISPRNMAADRHQTLLGVIQLTNLEVNDSTIALLEYLKPSMDTCINSNDLNSQSLLEHKSILTFLQKFKDCDISTIAEVSEKLKK